MECNKEEAFRARDIAEKKMQTKEFISARKIALKAQQLYADLENISQMLMVCDVHCAADKKVAGNEVDWYGILQVDQKADSIIIKKQYKKFALLLHPDKNKFPGAESAFKLIGEAQRVLLDKDKRQLHDMKLKAFVSKPPQRPPQSQNFGFQNNFGNYRNNTTGVNPPPPQHPAQQRASNGRATFWTACPFCHVKYEYFSAVMNKLLICQTCTKPFVAYERIPQGASMNRSTFPERKDFSGQGFTKVELTSQEKSSTENPKPEVFQRKAGNMESQKVNGKRRRAKDEEESSESCDSDSDSDSDSSIEEEDYDFSAPVDPVDPTRTGDRPRRSDRQRQRVSYKEENESDEEEDTPSPSEKAEEKGINGIDVKKQNAGLEKDGPTGLPKEPKNPESVKGKEKVEDGFKETDEMKANDDETPAIEIPEAEFFDFDSLKSIENFEVGQIWSLYSDDDGLPKYYAEIMKVSSPQEGFKVRLRWLASSGLPENSIPWTDSYMPICCGYFEPKKGGQNYTSKYSFSHQLSTDSTGKKHEFSVMPKRGQIWALYRSWTAGMKISDLQSYEYELVEIIEESGSSIEVVCLEQVDGFNSVFRAQMIEGSVKEIPVSEILRFSHQIPAFKLTDEKDGSLRGFWELDPAALPVYYFGR